MDGNRDSNFGAGSCSVTLGYTPVWWMVDLDEDVTITNVIITSRNEGRRLKLVSSGFINFYKLANYYMEEIGSAVILKL